METTFMRNESSNWTVFMIAYLTTLSVPKLYNVDDND
jgi:hypothetical protein